jgi:hypothetical protein
MSPYSKDVLERMIRTFIQGALAAALADGALQVSLSGAQQAGIAGLTALLSLLMSLLGKPMGDPNSASVLSAPAPSPPPATGTDAPGL